MSDPVTPSAQPTPQLDAINEQTQPAALRLLKKPQLRTLQSDLREMKQKAGDKALARALGQAIQRIGDEKRRRKEKAAERQAGQGSGADKVRKQRPNEAGATGLSQAGADEKAAKAGARTAKAGKSAPMTAEGPADAPAPKVVKAARKSAAKARQGAGTAAPKKASKPAGKAGAGGKAAAAPRKKAAASVPDET